MSLRHKLQGSVAAYLLILVTFQAFFKEILVFAQVPLYGQCGGEGYPGSTKCATDVVEPGKSTICKSINQFYHYCTTCISTPTTALSCPTSYYTSSATPTSGSLCVTSSCATMTPIPVGGQCGGVAWDGSGECAVTDPNPSSSVVCQYVNSRTHTCHSCEIGPPSTPLTCTNTRPNQIVVLTTRTGYGSLCYTSLCITTALPRTQTVALGSAATAVPTGDYDELEGKAYSLVSEGRVRLVEERRGVVGLAQPTPTSADVGY